MSRDYTEITDEQLRTINKRAIEQPSYDALREQNRVLREALQPFAKVAEAIDGQVWVQYLWVQSRTNPKENICISADHVRAAKAALTATSQEGQHG